MSNVSEYTKALEAMGAILDGVVAFGEAAGALLESVAFTDEMQLDAVTNDLIAIKGKSDELQVALRSVTERLAMQDPLLTALLLAMMRKQAKDG